MEWFRADHVVIGILADTLTFAGGCILTRDAFLRLGELRRSRVDGRFKAKFPILNLTDAEWETAVTAMRWTVASTLAKSRSVTSPSRAKSAVS